MADDLLTSSTVVAYVKEHCQGVEGLPLSLDADLEVREITGGNLNYAFCVQEAGSPAKAVFVKQAPGFIKCLGPEFALSARRAVFESKVMQEFQQLAPAHSPRHLLLDEARCILVLQFMHGYVLLRDTLLAGGCGARVASDLGTFMAATQRKTHATLVGETERAALEARFENPDMCGITAEYVFSKPLDPDDPTNRCSEALAPHAAALRGDAALKAEMLTLRACFLERKECLLHGDLHTGSIMVPAAPSEAEDKPAVVIDAEFAFYGPAAFDAGVLLANLLFAAIRHAPRPDVQASILATLTECWRVYMAALSLPAAAAEAPLRDAAGFCGCELVRRVVGAAHVDDLESIAEPAEKLQAERVALELGSALLKGRQALASVEQLLELLKAAAQRVSEAS